ncbi:MAG: acetyl-CoA carboxylase biotin carboxyl carrier protein [Gemmataceae bacterium]|nr:acetyl-CoA carboxylase biotin carboxyl carrier protein [Gemmata sp.]MDW8196297.1 acetyl-CoA carboxylase biotin carboxyl carrier protein [Gemmataceae bacterium]
MADDKRDMPRPFDVRTVEYLLKLMTAHELAEIDLKEGDQRIRLRKGTAVAPALYPAAPAFPSPLPLTAPAAAPVTASPPATANGNSPVAPPPPPPTTTKNLIEIKSPMVGTFYAKPDPKKPDYVTLGSKVTPKTVVCTIEAMKLYNEVYADCTGTIVEICKKSGEPVEYGEVLFRVDPA